MSRRFEDKRILDTGAAGGIGRAIVDAFRSEGAWVCACGHSLPDNGDCNVAADLASDTEVEQAVAAMVAAGGSADVVVHAAAASVNAGIADTPSADWLRLYDVNVVGAVRLMRACAPAMRDAGGGVFTLLSSINARFATPTLAAYATSKAALDGLIRTAALELARDGIRVNGVAPASVDTALLARNFAGAPDPAAARAANVARHPLGRLGTPEDVARSVLFVSSAEAGWMTGTIMEIDGGAGVTRR